MNINSILLNLDEKILELKSNSIEVNKILVNLKFYKTISNEKMNGKPWTTYRGISVEIEDQSYPVALERCKTEVVNKYHLKEKEGVYIGRGSVWGNPFTNRELSKTKAEFQTNSREESIDSFEKWIVNQSDLMSRISELRGKKLVCFCKPKSCHGDILAKLAEEGQSLIILIDQNS